MAGITITADSGTEFTADSAQHNAVCKLDSTHFAIAYSDNTNGNIGRVNVGSRSGSSITISSSNAVTFYNSAVDHVNITAMSSTLILIGFVDSVTKRGVIVAASISGSIITVGTSVQADNGHTSSLGMAVASLDGTYFVTGHCSDGFSALDCYAGSISGTTITLGSPVTISLTSGHTGTGITATGLDSTHAAYAFTDWNAISTYIVQVMACSVNTGTLTPTFGSQVNAISSTHVDASSYPVISAFGSSSFVVGALYGSSSTMYLNGGTVSGTTIAVGSLVAVLASVNTTVVAATYSVCTINTNSFLLTYYTTTNTQAEIVGGSISGTTLSWDAQGAVIFDNATSAYTNICQLDTTDFIIGYNSG